MSGDVDDGHASAIPSGQGPGEYLFDNADRRAAEQMRLLGEILDADSVDVLSTVGIEPGWRCWDIGSGQGSVARWLAARGGDVLATDLQPHHIQVPDTVGVRAHDLRHDPVPGQFDLIHARLVLMHLPDPESVLAGLAAALNPGGVLVVSEWGRPASELVLTAPDAETRALVERFGAALASVCDPVMDFDWGHRLGAACATAGLRPVRSRDVGDTWVGGGPGCRLFALHTLLLESSLEAAGFTADDRKALREAMIHPDLAVRSLRLFTIIGRRSPGRAR